VKITKVRATPVNLPLEAPYIWALGRHPGFSKTIVEVETDQGLVGLGEAPSAAAAALIDDGLGEALEGLDALDPAGAEAICVPEIKTSVITDDAGPAKAFGGIEMALWDIRGKAWDAPLYLLLGGAARKEVPFTEYFAFRERVGEEGGEATPEDLADYCQAMVEAHGSTFFEGKVSCADPALAVAIVRALRDGLGPGAMLRLDSNMAYSLATAVEIARGIEPLGVRNWEEPCATFEEMAKLRRATTIPFSAHLADPLRAHALGAPDAIVADVAALGGVRRTADMVAACETLGIDFWFYSGGSGIATAAYLHLAAALPWIREPSQSLFRWQVWDVVEDGPFQPASNLVPVPEGPGLGVNLDRDALGRAHRHFVEHGPLDYYDDPQGAGRRRRLPIA
jgi:glucarate dehydratase